MSRVKKIIFIATITLLLAACGFLLFYYFSGLPKDSDSRSDVGLQEENSIQVTCSDDVIKSADLAIYNDDMSTLESIAGNILKEGSFNEDPNCLYIMTEFYVRTSSSVAARKYFEDLKVYAAGRKFSDNFTYTYPSIGRLESSIETIESNDKDMQGQHSSWNEGFRKIDFDAIDAEGEYED